MTTPTTETGGGVHDLVRQRDQLRSWIAKLDEVQTGVPGRVTERVRADYQDRLRRVTEELSAHGEEIARSLDGLRADLAAAEERRAHASDALEEARLRNLIGEMDDAAWEETRPALEEAVAAAEDAAAHAHDEVERLSALSRDIADAAAGSAGASPEPEPAAATEDDGGGMDDDRFGAADGFGASAPSAPEARADDGDEWEDSFPDESVSAPVEAEGGFGGAAGDDADGSAEGGGVGADAAAGAGTVSGEELAAWITEIEAETTAREPSADRGEAAAHEPPAAPAGGDRRFAAANEDETAEAWDPFANEFGGSPAAPTTQPGEATQDLPWLDGIEGGAAGKWASPSEPADELAFLDNLENASPAPGAQANGGDLAADDLAFLEELDRAISGGPQRPAAPPAEPEGLGNGFAGGSGGGFTPPPAAAAQPGEEKKRGEALLCKECGAINEPQAWYCEICGSEL